MRIDFDAQEAKGIVHPGGTTVVTLDRARKWWAYHNGLACYYAKVDPRLCEVSRLRGFERYGVKHRERADAWERAIEEFTGKPLHGEDL